MSIIIRNEIEADYRAVENLTREAFWNIYRPGCTEHFILHKFRFSQNFLPKLDFVMEKDGKLIGHIMYAKAAIQDTTGKSIPIATFGPLSIAPDHKRQGYGKQLLDYSLQKAADQGIKAVAITGNIAFYEKSGFVRGSERQIRYAYADPADKIVPYFLVKELQPNFFSKVQGLYKDPDEYFAAEKLTEEFKEFDSTFPYKEKQKLPGQLL